MQSLSALHDDASTALATTVLRCSSHALEGGALEEGALEEGALALEEFGADATPEAVDVIADRSEAASGVVPHASTAKSAEHSKPKCIDDLIARA